MSKNSIDVTNGEIMFVLAKLGVELDNLATIVNTLLERVDSETEGYAKFPSKETIAKNYGGLLKGISDDGEAEDIDAGALISIETSDGSKGFKVVCSEDNVGFIREAVIKAIEEQGFTSDGKKDEMNGKKKC